MKYRAEIDGLRAFAVLPVILFHAGFEWFSGGFVGVDVFFVISGYLITTIIISEIAEGKFSIINFYERRARRILPALFFVMAASLPFAWLWLAPADLKDFGQSIVAVSTSSSNILFWLESGYFDTATELKPLLHTWSLAIEEQYYIIFPIFLLLTWRLGIKWILILLSLIFIISLGIAHWGAFNKPSATFFLLPARGWELLIGVFCAFYLKHNTYLKSHLLNQVLSILGFSMITYSIVIFDKNTPFPSLYALVPTTGAALLILSAVPKTLIHNLLILKPIVGIGLISYSAYLWHYPLLSFSRHYTQGEEIANVFLILLCFMSLPIAWFSWKYVEAPFRNRKKITQSSIFQFSLVGIIGFVILGLILHFTNGLENLKVASYNAAQKRVFNLVNQSTNYNMDEKIYFSNCKFWAKNVDDLPQVSIEECSKRLGSPVLVLGDSHAMNVYNIVAKAQVFSFVIGLEVCRPDLLDKSCPDDGAIGFLRNISSLNPLIVYHQSGSYLITDSYGRYEPALTDEVFYKQENVVSVALYLEKLSQLGGSVVWLGPFTEYRVNASLRPTYIKKFLDINFKVFSTIEDKILSTLDKEISFKYVGFNKFFQITDQVVFDGCLIWRDGDHLSSCGEKHIAENADWTILSLDETK